MTVATGPPLRHNCPVAKRVEQKNFPITTRARRAFEEWCDGRGLTHTRAFLAGFVALSTMEPSQRDKIFLLVQEWERNGWDGIPTPPHADAEDPTRGSQRARSA
jgi:hypothetical protein